MFRRIFFLLLIPCLAACGCQSKTPAQTAAQVDPQAALANMVIDANDFSRDHMKPCTHTQECMAPLACFDGACIIPPSISGKANAHTPVITVKTENDSHPFHVEVVDDEYTMSRGLMMRRNCLDGWGMIFVYADDAKRSFWMHNTYIPLDMVFIRKDGSVSNVIESAEPLNDIPRYQSTDRVRYVLELPAGTAERCQIKSGSTFDLSALN